MVRFGTFWEYETLVEAAEAEKSERTLQMLQVSNSGCLSSRVNWRQQCTTFALMPRAMATLATDAPGAPHSVITSLNSHGIAGVQARHYDGHNYGPSSFRVEPNSQNRWSSSSPVGMWAGCI